MTSEKKAVAYENCIENCSRRGQECIIDDREKSLGKPSLLMHSCCGPCSTACIERMAPDYEITIFFYNPNITEEAEYRKRVDEIRRLIREQPHVHEVTLLEGPYEPERFFSEAARGYEDCREGGERCARCFRLRLSVSAAAARRGGFDYVSTTLTISPLKNAAVLNAIGEEVAAAHQVAWLPCDFKKKDGYKRSTQLSDEYGLYRQDYCGCIYSLRRDLQL